MPASNRLAEVAFSKYNRANPLPCYYSTPDDEIISTVIDLSEAVFVNPSLIEGFTAFDLREV